MPNYDYHCPANGRTLEVSHKLDRELATWGELCGLAGADPGDTPGDARVEKVYSFAAVVGSRSAPVTPCGKPECAGGACAFGD